jgi:hypothetical protein
MNATLEPTAILLTPISAFAARAATLQITAVATHFSAATRVEFDDPEIKAMKVTAGSDTLLQVQIQSSDKARLGAHDLTITTSVDGKDEKLTLKGAFSLQASLLAEASGNSRMAPQGGILSFAARNLDGDNPLAGTLRLSTGLRGLSAQVSAGRIAGLALVDPATPAGRVVVNATANNGGTSVQYVMDPMDANAPQVAARAPVALTAGMTRMGDAIPGDRQTSFYRLTTAADNQVLVLTVAATGVRLTGPLFAVLTGPGGKFSDGQFARASANGMTQTLLGLLPKTGDQFVALAPVSLGGGVGYEYSLTPRVAAGRSFSSKEPMTPDTPAMPLATVTLDGPAYSTDGAFDRAGDVDYIKIRAQKGGRLYVQAVSPGTSLATQPPAVALLSENCQMVLAPAREVQNEVAAMMGVTYCVQVFSTGNRAEPYQLIAAQDL